MENKVEKEIQLFAEQLHQYRQEGLSVVASSSFQTHSIPMLHIISKLQPELPVYFLQTGFHFPETIKYKNKIAELYSLNVIEIESQVSKSMQRDSKGQFYFVSNPGYCCHINKVLPMDEVMRTNHVWISGVRKDQSKTRKEFTKEAEGPHRSKRFHPMLNWDEKMIWDYIHEHNIPHHPLEAQGYFSVGCEPCTAPSYTTDGERAGRWAGMKKTECGLHTELTK